MVNGVGMAKRPDRKFIGDRQYKLTVFRIESEYEDGTPENLTLIKDSIVCELSDDPEKNKFMLVYVAENMLKGK